MNRRQWIISLGVPVLLWTIGSAPAAAALSEVPSLTNRMCPVLPDEPVDESIYVEFEGQRVYFCCQKCRQQFVASPEKYRAALVRVMPVSGGPAGAGPDHGDGAAHGTGAASDHSDHDHAADHGADDGEMSPLARTVRWAGRFHPVAVHFPIALLIAAVVTAVLSEGSARTGSTCWRRYYLLVLSIVAVAIGLTGHFGGTLVFGPDYYVW